MNWNIISQLITLSQRPLEDSWLEALQDKFNEHQPYYRFLYHLLLYRQPRVTLEIGTYYGVGAAHLAAAAATYGGQVIGIDLNEHETTRDIIPQRYGNFYFVKGDSVKPETIWKVWRLVEQLGPIGVVYQDSSHHYQASLQEWEAYTQVLDKGAIWICDDITADFFDPKVDPPGRGMVQYFEGLSGHKRLYKDVLHKGNTMGVVLF